MTDIELAPSMFLDKNDEKRDICLLILNWTFLLPLFGSYPFWAILTKKQVSYIITIEKHYTSDENVFTAAVCLKIVLNFDAEGAGPLRLKSWRMKTILQSPIFSN